MSELWKQYTHEIYSGLHYLATWPPSAKLAVGDIAVMQERTPDRHLSIGDLGVETKTIKGSEVHVRGWASSGAITVSAAAGATGPVHPGASAGGELEVSFNSKHAILLRAERSREDNLDRLDRVTREILRLHEEGSWKREWVLVTHVVYARTMIVLVANEKGAKAKLQVNGDIAAEPAAIVQARGSVSLLSASGMGYEERGVKDATPLYLAVRVQERIGRGSIVKRVGKRGRARPQQGDFEIADVTF
jgi:hypothetical protein